MGGIAGNEQVEWMKSFRSERVRGTSADCIQAAGALKYRSV
jgi:hypothetical protein